MMRIWTVHTAGNPLGAVQSCAACGHILQDNTGWAEGRVEVEESWGDRGPVWFPAGERVAEFGNCTVTLPDRPLEADERLCAGAN